MLVMLLEFWYLQIYNIFLILMFFFTVECECMAAAVLLLDVCRGVGKGKKVFVVQ